MSLKLESNSPINKTERFAWNYPGLYSPTNWRFCCMIGLESWTEVSELVLWVNCLDHMGTKTSQTMLWNRPSQTWCLWRWKNYRISHDKSLILFLYQIDRSWPSVFWNSILVFWSLFLFILMCILTCSLL
jgi:hypothetical protein